MTMRKPGPSSSGTKSSVGFLDPMAHSLQQARSLHHRLLALGRDLLAGRRVRRKCDAQRPGTGTHFARSTVDAGGAAKYGAPTSGPHVRSSSTALSRTLRVTTCSVLMPDQPSPRSGPCGLRPRVGFSPNTPQQEAGMRIEPPPSEACAAGASPAATAAAAPPLEPPAVYCACHGLRVGPNSVGSVVIVSPNSGVLVLPKMTSTALLVAGHQLGIVVGQVVLEEAAAIAGDRCRRTSACRSFSRNGTPRNGPSRQPGADRSAGVVVQLVDHGVERRVALLHARDRLLEQLLGRHLAVAHQLREPYRVVVVVFVEHSNLVNA